MQIDIIHKNENIVAVNKPVGINTHSDEEGGNGLDVVSLVQKQLGLDYLGVHHRLDREVSGLLVMALRKEGNAKLAQAFEGRQVIKEYWAIVRGRMPQRAGLINAPLIEVEKGFWKATRPGEKGAKPAATRYRVEKEGPAGSYTLVSLRLDTGRTHQLRVHLASVGCPIIGDHVYGQGSNEPNLRNAHPSKATNDIFPRLLLHAVRLTFPGNTPEQTFRLEAPPPSIFERAARGETLSELGLTTRFSQNRLTLAELQPKDLLGLNSLLTLAKERRRLLSDDPNQLNTAYRLINGAGDGLPGITLDKYGESLVLNCYEENLEANSPGLKLLLTEIGKIWPSLPIYAKFRPKEASKLGTKQSEVAPELPLRGEPVAETTVKENGLSYLIKPGDGLSPGLFLDMREIRARLADLSQDKTVLNCFSFTCAFGVVAVKHGAKRVLNLDAGRKVLDWGKQNYSLNEIPTDDYDFVEGDVFDWLNRFARRNQTFDIVILDPPSYSTVNKTRWSAERNYDELVAAAAKTIAPNGYLLACTNLAGLNRRAFRQAVLKGLETAGRKAEVSGYYHESNLDFPRAGQTEAYLKALLLKVS